MKKHLIFLPVLALFLGACSQLQPQPAEEKTTPEVGSEVGESMPIEGETAMTGESMSEDTIVTLAQDTPQLSTLVTAIQAAGLVEALSGPGPFTVFAPTNEAFEALDEAQLQALLNDPEALAEILQYHVVSGEVMAADVVQLDSAETLQGGNLTISTDDHGVMINDTAMVTQTDIEASNGVVHIIDTVLIPAEE